MNKPREWLIAETNFGPDEAYQVGDVIPSEAPVHVIEYNAYEQTNLILHALEDKLNYANAKLDLCRAALQSIKWITGYQKNAGLEVARELQISNDTAQIDYFLVEKALKD
jgi:hypothetical protein